MTLSELLPQSVPSNIPIIYWHFNLLMVPIICAVFTWLTQSCRMAQSHVKFRNITDMHGFRWIKVFTPRPDIGKRGITHLLVLHEKYFKTFLIFLYINLMLAKKNISPLILVASSWPGYCGWSWSLTDPKSQDPYFMS